MLPSSSLYSKHSRAASHAPTPTLSPAAEYRHDADGPIVVIRSSMPKAGWAIDAEDLTHTMPRLAVGGAQPHFYPHAQRARSPMASSSSAPSMASTSSPTSTTPSSRRTALTPLGLRAQKAGEALRQTVSFAVGQITPPERAAPPPYAVRERVYFDHKDRQHHGFTNFSPHPVVYNGKLYPTSEHLYQSFKFEEHRPHIAEHIRTFSRDPAVTLEEARRLQQVVPKIWAQIKITKMDQVLRLKFSQHALLKRELLATRDAELVFTSEFDAFWGVGRSQPGQNELGKALERLRDELREEQRCKY